MPLHSWFGLHGNQMPYINWQDPARCHCFTNIFLCTNMHRKLCELFSHILKLTGWKPRWCSWGLNHSAYICSSIDVQYMLKTQMCLLFLKCWKINFWLLLVKKISESVSVSSNNWIPCEAAYIHIFFFYFIRQLKRLKLWLKISPWRLRVNLWSFNASPDSLPAQMIAWFL